MATTRERRSAVLLDQHPLWLEAVEQVLTGVGVDVVGKATEANGALLFVEEHKPDLLVTEIVLAEGDMEGVRCVRRALELAPNLKAIVLSSRTDGESIRRSLLAGAVAYVVKTADSRDLASAIRQAFEHSVYLPNGLALELIATPPETRNDEGLTPREREVLHLVAEGRSNADVAKRLWVTERTVKVHLSNVYRKIGVSNRTEASRWAAVSGLLGDARGGLPGDA
jgi:DNA-binding NarL/FixJ family response regulator